MSKRRVFSSSAIALLISATLAVTAALGALVGVQLGVRASRAEARALSIADPGALPAAVDVARRSAGGFTGFGGPPALQGDVLRSGVTSEAQRAGLVLADGAAGTTVEYTQSERLFRIEPATGTLRLGEGVVVRIDGPHALAVLLVRLEGEAGR